LKAIGPRLGVRERCVKLILCAMRIAFPKEKEARSLLLVMA
jgi:hypothetical protein